ncbi:MAG: indole-3-glycerol phosphate synthase TrpC [Halanaerobiaceae bacterium]
MILDEIIAHKYREVKKKKESRYLLSTELQKPEMTLIAEIKKASPSKGVIARDFRPEYQLQEYQKGGAGAISILTDQKYFQGSSEIIEQLRPRAELPILRKEFIIDPLQIYESCLLGADVILLIAAVLNQKEITKFLQIAHELGLEAIVEVHNKQELTKVLETPARIIGINNRDLTNFTVNLETTEKLVDFLKQKNLRQDYHLISESGIHKREDIKYLSRLGVNGVLIGESLMRAPEPAQKIKELLGR